MGEVSSHTMSNHWRSLVCSTAGCGKGAMYCNIEMCWIRACTDHKAPGMIAIYAGLCHTPGCRNHALYKYPFELWWSACATHKKPGMMPRVLAPHPPKSHATSCSRVPRKTPPSIKRVRGTRCAPCYCEFPGCRKHASYGDPGKCLSRCMPHREPNMVNSSGLTREATLYLTKLYRSSHRE